MLHKKQRNRTENQKRTNSETQEYVNLCAHRESEAHKLRYVSLTLYSVCEETHRAGEKVKEEKFGMFAAARLSSKDNEKEGTEKEKEQNERDSRERIPKDE